MHQRSKWSKNRRTMMHRTHVMKKKIAPYPLDESVLELLLKSGADTERWVNEVLDGVAK